jgi:uncharacterized membrane protein
LLVGRCEGSDLKIRVSDNQLAIIATAVALLAGASAALLPATAVTFTFAVVLFFFLPGYALTRMIFDKDLAFDFFMLMSIGLSVVLVMLISLMLAMLGALSAESALVCLVGMTIVALLIDRIEHSENRRYEIEIMRPKKEDLDPVIAVAIAFGLVLIGIFGYIILTTHPPSTTHAFIKDPGLLPKNLTLGNAINVTVQVLNGEGAGAQFGIMVNSTNISGVGQTSFTSDLSDGETKDFNLTFTPTTTGYQQFKIEIRIDGRYYGEVHFWVNVV